MSAELHDLSNNVNAALAYLASWRHLLSATKQDLADIGASEEEVAQALSASLGNAIIGVDVNLERAANAGLNPSAQSAVLEALAALGSERYGEARDLFAEAALSLRG